MRSLSLKLTLAFLAVALISVILVAFFAGRLARTEFDHFIANRSQVELATRAADYYAQHGSWEGVEVFWQRAGREGDPRFGAEDQALALLNAEGRPVISSRAGRGPGTGRSVNMDSAQALPVEVDGKVVGYLQFAPRPGRNQPVTGAELAFLEGLQRSILLSAGVATLLALLLGIVLAGTISRPIRELTSATRKLSQGELGEQVPVRTDDELGQLSRSFNQMSTDLAESSRLRKQMTADIAHDLRTPLSVILGYTEALNDGKLRGDEEMYGAMHRQARHLNRLVDDLRTLSLVDAGQLTLERVPLAPCILLEHTLLAHTAQAQQDHISLTVDCTSELPLVMVDADRMSQVLHNLVSNAMRHTPAGGHVVLSARPSTQGVSLSVCDDGQGIPAEDIPYIFDRFYRGDEARSDNGASGLGLAITRSLVEAHGGQISAESGPDQGTCFFIDLPLTEDQV